MRMSSDRLYVAFITVLPSGIESSDDDELFEFLYANSYLAEIEKMTAEVLVYLKRHPSELALSEAA